MRVNNIHSIAAAPQNIIQEMNNENGLTLNFDASVKKAFLPSFQLLQKSTS
jgi:hypothetical protein